MDDILTRLQYIVAEQLAVDPSKVIPEAHFEQELGADSLDVVELVMKIEDEFDLEMDDDAASRIETVQDALNYIEARMRKY